jgi:SOS-response transcriptional repressor LexA
MDEMEQIEKYYNNVYFTKEDLDKLNSVAHNNTNLLDVSQYINTDKHNTFLIKVSGKHYNSIFFNDGDILIVDTTALLKDKMRVIARMDNELSIKIYRIIDNCIYLQTCTHKFLPISLGSNYNYEIIGAITGVFHNTEHK